MRTPICCSYDSAAKYAKGGKRLYRITVKEGRAAENVLLPINTVTAFVGSVLPRSAQVGVIADLDAYRKRRHADTISAESFLNLIINNGKANSKRDDVRDFLVANGVDYSLVPNAGGWHEMMVVLYNTDLIVRSETISRSTVLSEYDLRPAFAIEARSPSQVSGPLEQSARAKARPCRTRSLDDTSIGID